MFGEEDMQGLEAAGLKPLIIDENFDFNQLPSVIAASKEVLVNPDGVMPLGKVSIKTNGKRNKQAGYSWEREIVKRLKEIGYNVATSRNASRMRDAMKVDIVGLDPEGFPANIQAKNESRTVKFQLLLSQMPKEKGVQNVVVFKQTSRAEAKFVKQGEYAIMNFESFLYYLELEKKYKDLLYVVNHRDDEIERLMS